MGNRTTDETTILHFRRLLAKHELSRQIFNAVNQYLADKGLRFSRGTIVDAAVINAPSSTKNRSDGRDPEMHSAKKGNQCYFGEKIRIGADAQSDAIHSVAETSANVHDVAMTDEAVREKDKHVLGDSGYRGISKRTRHKNVVFLVSAMRSKRKHRKALCRMISKSLSLPYTQRQNMPLGFSKSNSIIAMYDIADYIKTRRPHI